jgi:hypothetical protein
VHVWLVHGISTITPLEVLEASAEDIGPGPAPPVDALLSALLCTADTFEVVPPVPLTAALDALTALVTVPPPNSSSPPEHASGKHTSGTATNKPRIQAPRRMMHSRADTPRPRRLKNAPSAALAQRAIRGMD